MSKNRDRISTEDRITSSDSLFYPPSSPNNWNIQFTFNKTHDRNTTCSYNITTGVWNREESVTVLFDEVQRYTSAVCFHMSRKYVNHSAQRGSSKITRETTKQAHTGTYARQPNQTKPNSVQCQTCWESTDSTMRKQILADKRLRRWPPLCLPPYAKLAARQKVAHRVADRVRQHSVCQRRCTHPEKPLKADKVLQHWLQLRVPLPTWSQQVIHCSCRVKLIWRHSNRAVQRSFQTMSSLLALGKALSPFQTNQPSPHSSCF